MLSDRLTRLSIDLDALLRRCKSDKWRAQLSPRPIDRLVAAASLAESSRLRLLPDTNVYIRNLAGTLPTTVAALIDQSLLWHSSVCLGRSRPVSVTTIQPQATGVASGNIMPRSLRQFPTAAS